jgi:hypothetical protein
VSGKKQKESAESACYIFFYPQESITIYSDYPFPGCSDDFCHTTQGISSGSTCNYFCHGSSLLGWTWSNTESDQVSTGNGGASSLDTLDTVSSRTMEPMEIVTPCEDNQPNQMQADDEEDASIPSEPLWIWHTLHGVCVDDGCIKVHLLCKLHKLKCTNPVQSTSKCSHEEHLKRACAIAELCEIWPKNGSFEEVIACVLSNLLSHQEHNSDACEPSMEIIKGEFNNHLIFIVTDKQSSSN